MLIVQAVLLAYNKSAKIHVLDLAGLEQFAGSSLTNLFVTASLDTVEIHMSDALTLNQQSQVSPLLVKLLASSCK